MLFLSRYFGLVPQVQSGDRNRLGHITSEGAPVVRQLVAEATWQAIRRSPSVRAFFERAQRDDPQRKKIALVATAQLSGAGDVGHAEARDCLGGESDLGQEAERGVTMMIASKII
jgi:Transposase IS116/IS110/IS902 family